MAETTQNDFPKIIVQCHNSWSQALQGVIESFTQHCMNVCIDLLSVQKSSVVNLDDITDYKAGSQRL